jgi:porphobilinogen deaminase
MQVRGKVFNDWVDASGTEEAYSHVLENGCYIDVHARELPSGDIQLLVCVYASDGTAVYEHVSKLDAKEWSVEHALDKGLDQAERIAGGEGGRLPCADAALPLNPR